MKKTYNIKNIHCADCARSLEESIATMQGVDFVHINFLTEKMTLEIKDDSFSEIIQKIRKLIRDFSSAVEFNECVKENQKQTSKTHEIRFKLSGDGVLANKSQILSAINKLKDVESAEIQENKILIINSFVESSLILVNRIKSLINAVVKGVKVKELKQRKSLNVQLLCYCIGLLGLVPIILAEKQILTIGSAGFYLLVVASAVLMGYSTFITAIKMLRHLNINENLLVMISVAGAILLGETIEGLMVVALYTLGKILEAKAVNKSRKSIKSLLDIRPEKASVIRNGIEEQVDPQDIEIDEVFIVRPGEKVALDGNVINGTCNISTQSLTGESMPCCKQVGDTILSGSVVLDGVLEIQVTHKLAESTTTKILNLIEKAAENKSKTETFISKFSKYYTLLVICAAVLVCTCTGIFLGDWAIGVYRGLIFLVISCPCAFAISVPLSYFSGIGNASKKGILIKGSNYLDACAKTKLVAFDKTGTLTTGNFELSRIETIEDAYSEQEILEIAGMGEQNSIHPLSKAILNKLNGKNLPKVSNYKEIAGIGITFEYEETSYFVGRDEESGGGTSVIVKKGNVLLGKIYFEDKLKDSSGTAIRDLHKLGVDTVILTGDKKEVAVKISKELDGTKVYAEMLPQDKYEWIENKKNQINDSVLYVGDGINDAPSLALADVGVSMGISGSAASIEASDIVLVDDKPEKIVELVKISKHTKKIVLQNIIFAASIKIACLLLGTFGLAKMFMAVFADVGVTILAVLNSLRALKYESNKKDFR